MVRSSYIDWLLEQNFRKDAIGDVSRWLHDEMSNGFEPVDMFCLLDRADGNDHLFENIKGGLVEFAMGLESYSEITDEQTLKSKLDVSLRNEDYLKAAEIRDELNKIKREKNESDEI